MTGITAALSRGYITFSCASDLSTKIQPILSKSSPVCREVFSSQCLLSTYFRFFGMHKKTSLFVPSLQTGSPCFIEIGDRYQTFGLLGVNFCPSNNSIYNGILILNLYEAFPKKCLYKNAHEKCLFRHLITRK